MANNIAWEALDVGVGAAVGPTATLLAGKQVLSAIFYVDPRSTGTVRYRADQIVPTGFTGIPLRPGKSIVVAGRGNVNYSLFISEGGPAIVHCLYYDQVDVVDLGLSGEGMNLARIETALATNRLFDEEMLREMRSMRLGMVLTGLIEDVKVTDLEPTPDPGLT